jgi:hypothetical protein
MATAIKSTKKEMPMKGKTAAPAKGKMAPSSPKKGKKVS